MPLISVLTPVYGPTARYLNETAAGVHSQSLPPGWELEWIVQEDGPSASLAGRLEDTRYGSNGAQLGVAVTRNAALARARGALVQVLDHDDVLLPHALSTLITHFADPSVHWAVGQADDLMPDGTRKSFPTKFPFGSVPAGAANAWAVDHDANWPIHCAGLMMRTASLQALGGWAAMSADDDIAMFAALSAVTNGYNDPTLTWLYRQHPDQTHRSLAWKDRGPAGRRVALQRAAAIQATGLQMDLSSAPGEPTLADVKVGPARKEVINTLP
jgi:glycosyltransferase involved in cell wall biosynthesis